MFSESDFKNLNEMSRFLDSNPVFGEEVWLDCLVTAVEEEEDGFVNRLFTRDAILPKDNKPSARQIEKLQAPLYDGTERVLDLFELKARAAFYQRLQSESLMRQELIAEQNKILHHFATELEYYVTTHDRDLDALKAKKEALLSQLTDML